MPFLPSMFCYYLVDFTVLVFLWAIACFGCLSSRITLVCLLTLESRTCKFRNVLLLQQRRKLIFKADNLSFNAGSGLHTFVLYLGPHIALFTIKAVQCGRVDLKIAPYDTIQLKVGPSWLDKKCSEFGPPVYPASAHSVRIPVFDLLPQIQLEAVLWGIGTALGELPPYFISRAGKIASPFSLLNLSSGIVSYRRAGLVQW